MANLGRPGYGTGLLIALVLGSRMGFAQSPPAGGAGSSTDTARVLVAPATEPSSTPSTLAAPGQEPAVRGTEPPPPVPEAASADTAVTNKDLRGLLMKALDVPEDSP